MEASKGEVGKRVVFRGGRFIGEDLEGEDLEGEDLEGRI